MARSRLCARGIRRDRSARVGSPLDRAFRDVPLRPVLAELSQSSGQTAATRVHRPPLDRPRDLLTLGTVMDLRRVLPMLELAGLKGPPVPGSLMVATPDEVGPPI
ncbi:MAG: hypothetical protein R3E66_00300 [bacterium]